MCWGGFPFLSVTAAVGLKENFFCLFIVTSFYFMYKYKKSKNIFSLVFAFISIFCCSFFRMAIPLMIIISLMILLMVNKKNSKKILVTVFVIFVIGVICLDIIFAFVFPYSLGHLLAVTFHRASKASNNIWVFWVALVVSSFIGPFSNFSKAVGYALLSNSGLLFKTLISFPLLVGIWHIIKTYNYQYYALIAYVGMGFIMVGLSGASLDMRYQVTFFPFMLSIIAYAFQKQKINNLIYYSYIILSCAIIILYNYR
jgi:hypothetical protein